MQRSCPWLSRPSGPAHRSRRCDPLGDCDRACFAAATSERATSSRYAIGRRRQRTARLEEASRTAAPSRGAIKSDPSMIDLRSRCGPCWAEGWSSSAPIHLLQWGTEWRKRRGEPDIWHLLLLIWSLAGGNAPVRCVSLVFGHRVWHCRCNETG